jgi:N-methylhydantoinase A
MLGKLDLTILPAVRSGFIRTHRLTRVEAMLAQPLDLDTLQAAFGVAEVVDENMANAARVHAVENGEDLGDYTMIAFGGAAPLHAGRLCEKLGIAAAWSLPVPVSARPSAFCGHRSALRPTVRSSCA